MGIALLIIGAIAGMVYIASKIQQLSWKVENFEKQTVKQSDLELLSHRLQELENELLSLKTAIGVTEPERPQRYPLHRLKPFLLPRHTLRNPSLFPNRSLRWLKPPWNSHPLCCNWSPRPLPPARNPPLPKLSESGLLLTQSLNQLSPWQNPPNPLEPGRNGRPSF